MREILFRGKRATGEWVEGYLFDDGLVDSKRMFIGSLVITEHKGQGKDVWDIGHDFYEVIPDTVGQFTGLTDKKGKRIFEDDIVSISIGNVRKIGRVFYSERAAKIGVVDETGENFSFMQQPLIKQYDIKVIGNIHDLPDDLPELLEVKP